MDKIFYFTKSEREIIIDFGEENAGLIVSAKIKDCESERILGMIPPSGKLTVFSSNFDNFDNFKIDRECFNLKNKDEKSSDNG